MLRFEQVLSAVSGKRPSPKGWVRGNCPFCLIRVGKQDKSQSLALNAGSGKWHCFRCSDSGMVREVPNDLASRVPIIKEEEKRTMDMPDGFIPLWSEPGRSAQSVRPALEYLYKRGITDEVIRMASIGCVIKGRYAGRIVIPVYDWRGKLVGWVARAWFKETKRKYLNAEGMGRQGLLYNEAALTMETHVPVLVVEGIFDTFPFWPNAVGVFGKPDNLQVEKLSGACRPVVMVLDGDAWSEGAWLAMKLRQLGQQAGYVRLPPGKDPDEVDMAEVIRLAQQSLDVPTENFFA